jgi:hypothetical protein
VGYLRAFESTSVSSRAMSPSICLLSVGSLVTPYLQHPLNAVSRWVWRLAQASAL